MYSEDKVVDSGLKTLDYSSIALWFSTGFFLGNRHFYSKKPYKLSNFGPNIEWFHSPRNITFNQALDEFTHLFESVIHSKVKGRKIILPLSGGLDSRTIAAALSKINVKPIVISYEFEGGIKETEYA